MNDRIEIIIDSKDNFCAWNPVKNDDADYRLQNQSKTVVSGKHAFFSLHDDSYDSSPRMSTTLPFFNREPENLNFKSTDNFASTNTIKAWEDMTNLV